MHLKPSIAPLLVLLLATLAPAADRRPSITRGVDFLYRTLNASGNWETVPAPEPVKPGDNFALVTNTNYTGRTALAVYALLSCGEKAIDPRLAKAIALLKESPAPRGTYALAFRCLALSSMPQTPEVRKALMRDTKALLANANARGQATYSRQATEQPDASNSQVMLLGLAAASDSGIEVPGRFFAAAKKAWHADQLPNGGWGYAPAQKHNQAFQNAHPGMTAAGLATLFLIANAEANPSSPRDSQDPHIEKAMQWLGGNVNAFFDFNFFGDRSLYVLYALERVGVAGGVKRFGDVSWFDRGTRYLESRQNAEGAWTIGVDGSTDAAVCSSFALLFLCHADAPAAINKLRYAAADDEAASPSWNGRQNDVSRLTEWIANQSERKLRWQIVDLGTPADIDDAPVLYIAGNKAPTFSDADAAVLKSYVERGGLIVFGPEARNKPFTNAVRTLGSKLFPGFEWRNLPDDHPIYLQQQFKSASWRQAPTVMGLSNGTRELLLLVDSDSSRLWQAGATPASKPLFELGANIVQYTGNPPRPIAKLPSPPAAAPAKSVSVARVAIKSEEPLAWPMLAARLAADASLALNMTTLQSTDPIPAGVKYLHLPVDGPGTYRDDAIKRLHDFTDAGGTILMEAVAGTPANVGAVNDLVARGWPEAVDEPIGEAIVQAVHVRLGAVTDFDRGKPLVMRKVGAGRLVVSRVDLSAGWAGLRHESIAGLTPQSAIAVMTLLLQP